MSKAKPTVQYNIGDDRFASVQWKKTKFLVSVIPMADFILYKISYLTKTKKI